MTTEITPSYFGYLNNQHQSGLLKISTTPFKEAPELGAVVNCIEHGQLGVVTKNLSNQSVVTTAEGDITDQWDNITPTYTVRPTSIFQWVLDNLPSGYREDDIARVRYDNEVYYLEDFVDGPGKQVIIPVSIDFDFAVALYDMVFSTIENGDMVWNKIELPFEYEWTELRPRQD